MSVMHAVSAMSADPWVTSMHAQFRSCGCYGMVIERGQVIQQLPLSTSTAAYHAAGNALALAALASGHAAVLRILLRYVISNLLYPVRMVLTSCPAMAAAYRSATAACMRARASSSNCTASTFGLAPSAAALQPCRQAASRQGNKQAELLSSPHAAVVSVIHCCCCCQSCCGSAAAARLTCSSGIVRHARQAGWLQDGCGM